MEALTFCLLASGSFFMIGLLTGIWKYLAIIQSEKGEANEYVNVLHRVALMYAFTCILLTKFIEKNTLPDQILFWAALSLVSFLVFALLTYLIHAVLKDTDNQFRRPYILGSIKMPPFLIHFSMGLLILFEIGGFAVIFYGYLAGL